MAVLAARIAGEMSKEGDTSAADASQTADSLLRGPSGIQPLLQRLVGGGRAPGTAFHPASACLCTHSPCICGCAEPLASAQAPASHSRPPASEAASAAAAAAAAATVPVSGTGAQGAAPHTEGRAPSGAREGVYAGDESANTFDEADIDALLDHVHGGD